MTKKAVYLLFLIPVLFACKKVSNNQEVVTTASTTLNWQAGTVFSGIGRQNAVAFAFGSKGYIGLGNGDGLTVYNDLWEYNAGNKTWSKKADFPGKPRSAPTGFTIGNKAYVANGLCSCNDFWEYDPQTDKWTRKANFPQSGVFYTSSFTINGKAYVGTGINEGGVLLNTFWEYDPQADKWAKKADYPGTSVDAAVSFSILGKGYIATGNQAMGQNKELWQYDPVTDKWTKRKDTPYAASGAVGFAVNNRGYLGLGSGGGNHFWEYNPSTDTWKKQPEVTGSRVGAKAFVINNTAYVGLGTSAWTVYPTDIWTFAPVN